MDESSGSCHEIVGEWQKEKILGAGGFGMVILWKHVKSNHRIAIKQIRWANDPIMTKKHKQRWAQEVDIMKRLNHPNVVSAEDLPEELDTVHKSDGLPILAMEFCIGGDLRKVLNHSENCCGLKEVDVKIILKQISSALQYLHSMRIIHRDIKPENIVLQIANGKTVYKLIDLGYAKELDQNSLCTSFVGTLQYLAPELFMTQKYTSSVDYWSFGLVVHECITGKRPFFPNSHPAQWIPLVQRKCSEHISAVLDTDGNPIYSSQLIEEQQISGAFKRHMERWLAVMLEFDPQTRGCITTDGKREVIAFTMLNEIFTKKVLSIFLVDRFQYLYYEIISSTTMAQVALWVSADVGFSDQDLLLLTHQGLICDSQKFASSYCGEMEEDRTVIFAMIRTKGVDMDVNTKGPNIPVKVDKLFRNVNVQISYEEQRLMWEHCIFYLAQVRELYRRLFQAQNAVTVHLLARNSFIYNATTKMMRELSRLNAKLDFFNSSLHLDLQRYQKQAMNGGITSGVMYDNWLKTQTITKEVELIHSKSSELEKLSTVVNTKTIELQRSPYARNKASRTFEEIHEKGIALYDSLRKLTKEQRKIPTDSTPMITLIVTCIKNKEILFKDLYLHLRKSLECVESVQNLIPPIDLKIREINEMEKKLEVLQMDRQIDIWKLVDNLCKKIRMIKNSESSLSVSSLTTSTTSPVPSTSLNSSLSTIVNKTLLETPSLLYENSQIHKRLLSVQDNLNKTQDEAVSLHYSTEWEFLKPIKK